MFLSILQVMPYLVGTYLSSPRMRNGFTFTFTQARRLLQTIMLRFVFLVLATCAVSATPSFLFILADDIGWGDFHYNNGTALTPNIDAWVKRDGTVLMQDFHSGGTVCSPTRATVLTGRNHFRDCVNYVYGCSDMTECTPSFPFAPARTFTIGDAARAAGLGHESMFSGKW